MALIDRDREPTATELRVFGVLLAAFCGLLGGGIAYHVQAWTIAAIVWSVGVLLAGMYYGVPPTRRVIFQAWMAAVFPIGWLISHALLAFIYYGVLTPIGLVIRLWNDDLLHQKSDAETLSYWVPMSMHGDVKRYFQQF
jgi:hypothetical protein